MVVSGWTRLVREAGKLIVDPLADVIVANRDDKSVEFQSVHLALRDNFQRGVYQRRVSQPWVDRGRIVHRLGNEQGFAAIEGNDIGGFQCKARRAEDSDALPRFHYSADEVSDFLGGTDGVHNPGKNPIDTILFLIRIIKLNIRRVCQNFSGFLNDI